MVVIAVIDAQKNEKRIGYYLSGYREKLLLTYKPKQDLNGLIFSLLKF